MCTKWFSDGDVHKYFNPYGTPYEAFINFMNVLSDFVIRVEEKCQPSMADNIDEQIDKAIEFGKKVKDKTIEAGKKVKKKVKESGVTEMSLEDIANMSNAKIKELIRKVDPDELMAVLQNAGDDVKNRIIPNMGARARKKYEQVQDELKKVKKADIKKFTSNIEKEIKNLFS
jgi:polyribonucleotide nucleotidyltransferase